MNNATLPFSQACENNKRPILSVLSKYFAECKRVLEIGSGTGQHAVFFAENLRHLDWQPSDRAENHVGIQRWLAQSQASNLLPLVELDVTQASWPTGFDAVYSANTAHIMPWQVTQVMIRRAGSHLPHGGRFALYGPFNYGGKYSSDSNARFDRWLKESAAQQGIRDQEAVVAVAKSVGLELIDDVAMPANNRFLIWEKLS